MSNFMAKIIRPGKKRALERAAFLSQKLNSKKEMKSALAGNDYEDRMIEHHVDVLQNIEFVIVSYWRDNRGVDDMVVADALKAAILSQEPEQRLSIQLLENLREARNLRNDITDSLWRDGMRTVLKSVHRHSNLRRGSREYLSFACVFLPE